MKKITYSFILAATLLVPALSSAYTAFGLSDDIDPQASYWINCRYSKGQCYAAECHEQLTEDDKCYKKEPKLDSCNCYALCDTSKVCPK